MAAIMLTLCFMTLAAPVVSADDRTQIVYPIKGAAYSSSPAFIMWTLTPDVKVSQFSISAVDGSYTYNSGPIYHTPGSTSYLSQLPVLPSGKLYSMYIEDYHYSGNTYTGYSYDHGFFSVY